MRCSSRPWRDIDKSCKVLVRHFRCFSCSHGLDANRKEKKNSRWQVITALDLVLEIALVLYPVRMILRLQTSLIKNVIVVLILSCRLVYDITTVPQVLTIVLTLDFEFFSP